MKRTIGSGFIAFFLVACAAADDGGDAGATVEPKLSAIRSDIFEPRCSASVCHGGGASPAGNLNLQSGDVRAALVDVDSFTDPTVKRVVAGDPDASLLYLVLLGASNGVDQMPQGGELDDFEIEAIKTWIDDGANDD